jgi:capsular polysaccharide export protein
MQGKPITPDAANIPAKVATDTSEDRPTEIMLPERLFLGSPGAASNGESARHLSALLYPSRLVSDPCEAQAILAWGRKPSADKAQKVAVRYELPLWRMEDAFLRSFKPGSAEPPLGIVVDDLGIYYDASCESRLEHLIRQPLTEAEEARAKDLIRLWREQRVSKYNDAPDGTVSLPDSFVLAIDQTRGDLSITHGQADEHSFVRMLECALEENPGCKVVLKTHPEVVNGTKRGHFAGDTILEHPRVFVLRTEAHAAGLLEKATRVYTVTSQVGFEALLHGKPVRVFGMPFYAGWGLTEDEVTPPARRKRASLGQLAHAALVRYARYINAETGEHHDVEDAIRGMGRLRRKNGPAERRRHASSDQPITTYAVGFEAWKRQTLRSFMAGESIKFVRSPEDIPSGESIEVATWGTRFDDTVFPSGSRITRYEDGFIRSEGLGVRFAPPVSWIADRRGIYYDATRPSDLEDILQNEQFPEEILQRARQLRETIVRAGLTKYNLSGPAWPKPAGRRRWILVAGQVESDASLALGGGSVRTNIGLLKAVRAATPGACIVYKPHPDVVSQLRKSGAGEDGAAAYCDAVVTSTPIHQLIEETDEVHVMTSLTGFEALLRGKTVITYGRPFYAGWGLTKDIDPPARRTRKLNIDELVAGALIRYSLYRSPASGQLCKPEQAIEELAAGCSKLSYTPLERTLRLLQSLPFWPRFWAR